MQGNVAPGLTITGVGLCLPETPTGCTDLDQVQQTLRSGSSRLRPLDPPTGRVRVWAPITRPDGTGLHVAPRHLAKYSTASVLGAQSVRRALLDAGLDGSGEELGRTELVVGSTMFGADASYRQHAAQLRGDPTGVDYMLQGTPGSVSSAIALLNQLDIPVTTLTGSCVLGAAMVTLAAQRLAAGAVDRVVVVGVDAPRTPLVEESLTYPLDQGSLTMGYTGDDPAEVRPLDRRARGAGWGDGAVALVIEKAKTSRPGVLPSFTLLSRMGRANGYSPIGSGDPAHVANDVAGLLVEAGLSMADVPVWLDFCEGSEFVQAYFAGIVRRVRELTGYRDRILLSNCEAAYGHIGAAAALLKLLSGLSMASQSVLYPAVGCQQPDQKIDATPVLEAIDGVAVQRFLVLSCGSGGDRGLLLVDASGEG